MKDRATAGKLGFIKDSEGVYRKGRFVFKDGIIIRESALVPEGTVEDIADSYTTMQECIRNILSYSTTIGDVNPRTTDVYIDKVGNNYKPSDKFSKNTVAVVMSNRQVIEIKSKDITKQDDDKALENKKKDEKPIKAKELKSLSKPTEFDKLKTESSKGKGKLKLKESDATPEFLTAFKDLLNNYCRVSTIKDIELSNDTNIATLVFDNGYRKDINIAADSNLAVMEDILHYLATS